MWQWVGVAVGVVLGGAVSVAVGGWGSECGSWWVGQ